MPQGPSVPPKWIHRQPHARRQGPAGAMLLQPGLRQGEQPPMGPWLVSSVGAHGPAEHGIPLCHQVGSRRDAPRERRARPVPSPPPPGAHLPAGKRTRVGRSRCPFVYIRLGAPSRRPGPEAPAPPHSSAFYGPSRAGPGGTGRAAPPRAPAAHPPLRAAPRAGPRQSSARRPAVTPLRSR